MPNKDSLLARRPVAIAALAMGLPVVTSFIAWMIPGEGLFLRGFADRTVFTLEGGATLVAWYIVSFATLAAGTLIGVAIARRTRPRRRSTCPARASVQSERREATMLRLVTLLAAVGVGYAYATQGTIADILALVGQGQANQLSESFSQGSSLATLRYVSIIAFPLAVTFYLEHRHLLLYVPLTAALLLLSSLLSSRLSLLMGIAVLATLWLAGRAGGIPRVRWILVIASGVYLLLVFFNYSRNSGYYGLFGVADPFAMNYFQVLSYLGAPMQVSLAVANNISGGFSPRPIVSPIEILIPSFLQFDSVTNKSAVVEADRYGGADVLTSLNTNSVFSDIFAAAGFSGLVAALIVLFGAAIVYGVFSQSTGVTVALAGVLLYSFMEFWRVFLLTQGIVAFTVLSGLACWWLSGRILHDHPRPQRRKFPDRRALPLPTRSPSIDGY